MSDSPAETMNPDNAPGMIKMRSVAAIIRQLQTLIPGVDAIRAGYTELEDIIAIYGSITDDDLAQIGISSAQATALIEFLTTFFNFLDTPGENRPAYRSQINAVKRLGVQV